MADDRGRVVGLDVSKSGRVGRRRYASSGFPTLQGSVIPPPEGEGDREAVEGDCPRAMSPVESPSVSYAATSPSGGGFDWAYSRPSNTRA